MDFKEYGYFSIKYPVKYGIEAKSVFPVYQGMCYWQVNSFSLHLSNGLQLCRIGILQTPEWRNW